MNFETQEKELVRMGWSGFFRAQLTDEERREATVARIVEPLRGLSRAAYAAGEIWAEGAEAAGVGDWVVGSLRGAAEKEMRLTVKRLLNRQTKLSRTAPSGKNHEQILCANAETVFIVVALTQNLHLPGISRAITAADAGGLVPVLVLTKADTCADPGEILTPIKKAFSDLAIHVVSAAQQAGLEVLFPYFGPGKTVVLLGASGAGKSTLTNFFLGTQAQVVSETREGDEKGRHTTTARRMHFLASGGMIVDSPGIRELQPWKAPESKPKDRRPKGPRPRKNAGDYYDEDES